MSKKDTENTANNGNNEAEAVKDDKSESALNGENASDGKAYGMPTEKTENTKKDKEKTEDSSDTDSIGKLKIKKSKKKYDIIPKLVCLLLAVIIWYYVMQVDSPDYQETFSDVDIEITNSAMLEQERSLYVYSGYGLTTNVTVSGKKSIIAKYSSDDIKVTADILSLKEAGEYQINLNVSVPAGLTFVSSDLTEIPVLVDRKETATLLVETKITGATYSKEYEYGKLTSEDGSIVAVGPKTEIDKLDYACASVDFSSIGVIRETTSSVSGIYLVDKDGNQVNNPYIKLSKSEVKVTLPVYQTKEVPLKVSYYNGFFNDDNVEITLEPETVKIKGDPVELEKYDSINVVTLNEKKIDGDVTVNYTLDVNEDFTYVETNNVTMTLKHIGTTTKKYTVKNLDIVQGKVKYELIDKQCDVTLRGTEEQLNSITADDITLKVDFSVYDSSFSGDGSAPVTVVINKPGAEGVYEIGTYALKVRINK